VHYVSARALTTFRGGDICLVLVYKAMSPVLFGPPVSSSVNTVTYNLTNPGKTKELAHGWL
jgi:hypothetical protein